MTAAYTLAAIPEPFRILGLRMKPLCLGHFRHMERFNVSFASNEPAEKTFSDLILGVFICSQTYEDFLEFIERKDWWDEIKAWGKTCAAFDVPEKMALFEKYLKEGSERPLVIFENDGKPSGAHWTQSLEVALLQLGYTPTQAVNLPLGKAFADFYKLAENNGVVRIASAIEAEAIRALEEELCQT